MTAGVPYTFTPGQTPISSAQVNANFAALVSYINGLSIPTTPVSVANGGTGSTTAQKAITALGLATGTIIPCPTVSYSSGTFSLTGSANAAAVSAYTEGTIYEFVVPSTQSNGGTLYIQDVTTSGSGLAAALVYDSPGTSLTATLTAGQTALCMYSPGAGSGAGGFVLVNPPAITTTGPRQAFFPATGTLTVPSGITTMYVSGAGPGGGGGSCSGTASAGGGGGGGGAAVNSQAFSTVPGHLLAITIGALGAGGSGAAGSNGGTTTLVDSTTATTILVLDGGFGGAEGTTGSATTGGSNGGTGGLPGGSGNFFATAPISQSGAGGGGEWGAGGSSVSSGGGTPNQGVPGSGYGGGGSGGAGNGASGGNGAPSFLKIFW